MLLSRGVFRGGDYGGSSPSWISEIYAFLGEGVCPPPKKKKKCKPFLGKNLNTPLLMSLKLCLSSQSVKIQK